MKKRKHYETCMHCAFIQAFRTKHKNVKGKKERQKAFNDLVRSAIKITTLVFSKIDVEGQKNFMSEVMEGSHTIDRIIQMALDKVSEGEPSAAKGPTKH